MLTCRVKSKGKSNYWIITSILAVTLYFEMMTVKIVVTTGAAAPVIVLWLAN